MMHGHEKSGLAIVARKPANKAERSVAELVEPRAGAKGNASLQSTLRAQYRRNVSQAQERIRQAVGGCAREASFAVHTRGGSRMP